MIPTQTNLLTAIFGCKHSKNQHKCTTCWKKSTCEHNVRRSLCTDCKYGFCCKHGIRRSTCTECYGVSICEHYKLRTQCVDCKGGAICKHGLRRTRCVTCGGGSLCRHSKLKSQCRECRVNDYDYESATDTLSHKRKMDSFIIKYTTDAKRRKISNHIDESPILPQFLTPTSIPIPIIPDNFISENDELIEADLPVIDIYVELLQYDTLNDY